MGTRLPRRFNLAPIAAAFLVLGVACIGGQAPNVPPRGTLQIGSGDEGDPEKGPLRVVFGSPEGDIGSSAEGEHGNRDNEGGYGNSGYPSGRKGHN